jgi:hypothetical protein
MKTAAVFFLALLCTSCAHQPAVNQSSSSTRLGDISTDTSQVAKYGKTTSYEHLPAWQQVGMDRRRVRKACIRLVSEFDAILSGEATNHSS